MAFKKALIERALGAELGHHLAQSGAGGCARRRRQSPQRHQRHEGGVLIEVPRDRQGTFEPLLIPKHGGRFTGFDDKIIAM